ncbi:type I-C CRISPR-associated protein Cas8c/Csd1 [Treponema lecithinolyticum]|uniref:CRISPR-associated protein, Csd1 family n=1 Tax=Treponema lecithinolyticum ATCC 700332 TaxID=1321815 RepID=A0ABN0NYV1_TRELE|nr:type I-C CRISPR-associated protein Cas8c/Csd1 [Treponema lecithinolyticum]ERJ93148.1 CRISPR-associated protein, Csd1 family [Treponema lecithinolyticum ATCC 700332]
MILQALYEYAKRKGDALPEDGFEWIEIKYLIKIREDGSFVDLVSTIEDKKGKNYLLPQRVGRSGSDACKKSCLLWDNIGFVLREPKEIKDDEKKQKEANAYAENQNNAFIKKIESLPEDVKEDRGVAAVLKFYTSNKANGFDKVRSSEYWEECKKSNGNFSFILNAETDLVAQTPAVKEYQRNRMLQNENTEDSEKEQENISGICLLTGEKGLIARLHTATPISGAKSNAKFVGFQKNCGYDSFGKEQAYNAPVSQKAEAAYTKALNYLIKSDKNHFTLGKDTIVFWAEKENKEYDFEGVFSVFFSKDFDSDDPDKSVKEVKNLFAAIYTGKVERIDSNFYVLCLSPNAARISVRFWETGKVKNFAKRIQQHFIDFDIIRAPDAPEYLNLYQILSATALEHKMDNVAPNLIGPVVQSILKGTPYPVSLLQQCIRRIRAEQKVTRERTAILKAYINRYNRFHSMNEEVTVALDRNCKNKGYLVGRLFAVLEKVQQDTHPGLNATITDRYYGAASTNPVTVFPQLLKLNQHHLSNYANKKTKSDRENELSEIINALDAFPAHLTLEEQARFAIGYYHEKQSFFEKNNKSEGETHE